MAARLVICLKNFKQPWSARSCRILETGPSFCKVALSRGTLIMKRLLNTWNYCFRYQNLPDPEHILRTRFEEIERDIEGKRRLLYVAPRTTVAVNLTIGRLRDAGNVLVEIQSRP